MKHLPENFLKGLEEMFRRLLRKEQMNEMFTLEDITGS